MLRDDDPFYKLNVMVNAPYMKLLSQESQSKYVV